MQTRSRIVRGVCIFLLAVLTAGSFVLPRLIEPQKIALLEPPHPKNIAITDRAATFVCPPGTVDPTNRNQELAKALLVPDDVDVEGLKGNGSFYVLPGEDLIDSEVSVPPPFVLSYVNKGQWRSLLFNPCAAPRLNQYVGSFSTKVGWDSVLTLSNPSTKPAEITISAFSEKGPELGQYQVNVPAGQTITWVPSGFYPGREWLTLQVQSAVIPVAVWAQVAAHVGETPMGMSRIGGGAASLSAAFPFVRDSSGYSKSPSLLVTNPSNEVASVDVRVVRQKEGIKDLPGAQQLTIDPGTVLSLDLSGIGKEGVAVLVESSQPTFSQITYSVVGEKDKIVGEKVQSLTFVPPSTASATVTLPDIDPLARALKEKGMKDVSVKAAILTEGESPTLQVKDQKWLSKHAGETISPQAVSLLVSGRTSEGIIEVSAVLTSETANERTATVNVVP